MSLYELGIDKLIKIEQTTFSAAKVKERADLQRLLRTQIDAIVPDGMVLSEEFSNWDDSFRRIDLLVLDRDANLVVVELKRTEDGGHMELQAIRYAAMISAMTWDKAVDAHREFLQRIGIEDDPQVRMLSFLGWDEPQEDLFANDIRIVLASADFSKELTTSVLWLNERGLDIRCVRLVPYMHAEKTLIDIQQVIPLPEVQEYQVSLREKEIQERVARKEISARGELNLRFWSGLLIKANAVMDLHRNISPSKEQWLNTTSGGLQYAYIILRDKGRVELVLDRPSKEETKAIFDEIAIHRTQIDCAYGTPLTWYRNDSANSSKIMCEVTGGGLRDESTWDALQAKMVDAMQRMFQVLNPYIKKYRDGAYPVIPASHITS